jgi:HK97 family phage major capsid protein
MFNLVDLQQQLHHKTITAQDIANKPAKCDPPRTMNEDEIVIFDRLIGEIDQLKAQIASVEATNLCRDKIAKLVENIERPAGRLTAPDQPAIADAAPATKSFRVPATARRSGVMKAFKPRVGESQADCDYRAYRAGMWARAAIFRDQRASQWCLNNGLGLDLRNANMGTNSNVDGGFLVPDEMSQSIIDLREVYGVFRQNCRVWPMGSDTLLIPRRAGGVTVGALGENPSSASSSTTPTFSMVQLVAKKCGGLSVLSSEIAEDAVIDLADWIASEWAYAFALFEDTCGFTGDGTSTHLGIQGLTTLFTEAAGLAGAVLVATTSHNLFSEIDTTDIAGMMAKLPQYAKMGAKFYCSSAFNEMVFNRIKAGAGGNNVQTLQGAPGDTYLGYPVVISQVLPAGVATDYNGLAMCFFGDLSKSSSLGDRRQVRVFPSEHRYMDLDQIGILGTERIDIVNHDVGDATNPGSIVALVGSSS